MEKERVSWKVAYESISGKRDTSYDRRDSYLNLDKSILPDSSLKNITKHFEYIPFTKG